MNKTGSLGNSYNHPTEENKKKQTYKKSAAMPVSSLGLFFGIFEAVELSEGTGELCLCLCTD